MNSRDRKNLNWFMTADQETLEEWDRTASEDDYLYAQELMDAYKQELEIREKKIKTFDSEYFQVFSKTVH